MGTQYPTGLISGGNSPSAMPELPSLHPASVAERQYTRRIQSEPENHFESGSKYWLGWWASGEASARYLASRDMDLTPSGNPPTRTFLPGGPMTGLQRRRLNEAPIVIAPQFYNVRMIQPSAVVLEREGIRLEPLGPEHGDGLADASSDGELWKLWFTAVPEPSDVMRYIEVALAGQRDGHMLPWAVRDLASGRIIGSTRYHDIVPAVDRVEIGYTFYASSYQKKATNTLCKWMLLEHAFERLGCGVVGLRTDNFNFVSQQAIAALGAKKDGVIRHHAARRDGTVRDTVMYSILAAEWPDVRRHLALRLDRHRAAAS